MKGDIMIEINNKKLCESCFCETDADTCPHCGFSAKEYSADPLVLPMGTKINDKIIIGKVMGKGGFGITYLGYDLRMEKTIAVKEYYPNGIAYRSPTGTEVSVADTKSSDTFEKGAEKFYTEAQMVAQFNGNPNIVSVYDYFRANNTVYLIMEYLSGITLKNYIKKHGKLSDGQALFVMDKIAAALSITHSAGVLHRDISPDNIMLCMDGKVKLIDFGAARQIMAESSSNLTVVMKPGYTPIEQYTKKGKQGAWTDIYSLGVSVYYALTKVIIDDPYARMDDDSELKENKHNINNDLWEILKKCTMINASDRYGSAIDLRKALSSVSAPIKSEPINLTDDDLRADDKSDVPEASAEALEDEEFPLTTAADSSVPEVIEIFEDENASPSNDDKDIHTAEIQNTDPPKKEKIKNKNKSKKPIIIGICAAAVMIGAVGIFAAVNNSGDDDAVTANSVDVTENTAVTTEKAKSEITSVTPKEPKKNSGVVFIDDSDLAWSMTKSIPAETFEAFNSDILATLEINELNLTKENEDEYYHSIKVINGSYTPIDVRPLNVSFNDLNMIPLYEGQTELAFVIPQKSIKFIKDKMVFSTYNASVKSVTLEEYNINNADKIVEFSGDYPGDWERSEFISKSDLKNAGGDVRITLNVKAGLFGSIAEQYYLLCPMNSDWEPVSVEAPNVMPNDDIFYSISEMGETQFVFKISKEEIEGLSDEGLCFQLHNVIIKSAAVESAE